MNSFDFRERAERRETDLLPGRCGGISGAGAARSEVFDLLDDTNCWRQPSRANDRACPARLRNRDCTRRYRPRYGEDWRITSKRRCERRPLSRRHASDRYLLLTRETNPGTHQMRLAVKLAAIPPGPPLGGANQQVEAGPVAIIPSAESPDSSGREHLAEMTHLSRPEKNQHFQRALGISRRLRQGPRPRSVRLADVPPPVRLHNGIH